MDYQLALL